MAPETVDLGVGHLKIVETIGRGGFSVVYKALDTKLNRPVAVKVLNAVVDQSDLDRFDQECQIHGPLSDHPNIVTIHDAGYTPSGSPFLVMEYLDGGTLADHLRRSGPMPWPQAVELLAPVCDAVQTAHDAGVLHRDIKPANILLSPDGPKLADFGIACLSDATSPQFAVSWLHAPPEAEHNRRDERSDVYSLASTLFEAVTGRAPFWRHGDQSLAGLLGRIVTDPVPHLPPEVAPAWLDELLQRALAKDPARRPRSAAELRASLLMRADPAAATTIRRAVPPVASGRTLLRDADDRRGPAAPVAAPGSVDTDPSPGPPPPHQPPGGDRRADPGADERARRSRALPIAAALVALATIGLLVTPALSNLTTGEGQGNVPSSTTAPPATPTTPTSSGRTSSSPVTAETTAAPSSVTTVTTPTTAAPSSVTTATTPTTTATTPTTTATTSSETTTQPPPPPTLEVPNVAGLAVETAVEGLAAEGFTTIAVVEEPSGDVDAGLVIDTDPPAGSVVEHDQPITVVASSGPELVVVPDVRGRPATEARTALEELGFTVAVDFITVEAGSPDAGRVIDMPTAPGQALPTGSEVTIQVGRTVTIVTIEPPIVDPGLIDPPPALGP